MRKDKILAYAIIIVLCIGGFIGMCLRVDNLDNKKELSNPVTTEIR